MKEQYEEYSKVVKAISDASRLKILDILSCGEQCACDILENFEFTQPTLSHHMKVLIDCGIVKCRKEGTWIYYSLDNEICNDLMKFLNIILNSKEKCICSANKKSE